MHIAAHGWRLNALMIGSLACTLPYVTQAQTLPSQNEAVGTSAETQAPAVGLPSRANNGPSPIVRAVPTRTKMNTGTRGHAVWNDAGIRAPNRADVATNASQHLHAAGASNLVQASRHSSIAATTVARSGYFKPLAGNSVLGGPALIGRGRLGGSASVGGGTKAGINGSSQRRHF